MEFFGHKKVQVLNGGIRKWIQEGRSLSKETLRVFPHGFLPVPKRKHIANMDWIKRHLGNPNVLLVDARSSNEFNGKKKKGHRVGHLPGAINIDWKKTIDPIKGTLRGSRDLLKLIGKSSPREVVTYCQTGYRASHDYVVARHLGFQKVRVYEGSWQEWGNNPHLPLE
ncbi:MAG TPA: rhodanese-like domain-containing protein [Nitrospiria bacterium]